MQSSETPSIPSTPKSRGSFPSGSPATPPNAPTIPKMSGHDPAIVVQRAAGASITVVSRCAVSSEADDEGESDNIVD